MTTEEPTPDAPVATPAPVPASVIPFDFEGHEVRVVSHEGEPWFVAADVGRVLQLTNVRASLALLEPDERGVNSVYTRGGRQRVSVVSEAGLFSLILRSRRPEARKFQRWLTHEVLPSIRTHGVYATEQTVEAMLADPSAMIRVLEELRSEREARAEVEAAREADAPKVVFADAVAASEDTVTVGELAKILCANGVPVGQNRLFAWLRADGFLSRRPGRDWNVPTQRAVERGLLRLQETAITRPSGRVLLRTTVGVTGRGQRFFVDRYLRQAAKK